MRRMRSVFVILLASIIMHGCAPLIKRIDDTNRGIVIGYIDMDEAPTELEFVDIYQALPKTKEPYWGCAIDDGMFYHILPLGSYQISSFGGVERFLIFSGASYVYNMPDYGANETSVRLKKPGIYYAGSYKYKKIKTGFFSPNKFDLIKTDKPTERELLKRLTKDAAGTPWEPVIRKRLEELK